MQIRSRDRTTARRYAVLTGCVVWYALLFRMLLPGPASAAEASYVTLDYETGAIIDSVGPDDLWYPASLTKIMTVLLAFDALADGAVGPTDSLVVSKRAASQPPTRIGLSAGMAISLNEAMRATVVRSANDAAVLVAEGVAGTESRFVERMNVRAVALGMSSTHFSNATGLPDHDQVTTARDMAVLARELIRKFPERYALFDNRSIAWDGMQLPTYNGFLAAYPGADGLKTGFTCGSGFNLVASAVRNGRRVIGVYLGAHSRGERAAQMRSIMDAAFRHAADGAPAGARRRPASSKIPPYVLPGEACGQEHMMAEGVAPSGRNRKPVDVASLQAQLPENPPLTPEEPWRLALGVFATEEEARSRLGDAQKATGDLLAAARTAIEPEVIGASRFYGVALSNLTHDQAVLSCRFLRRIQFDCRLSGPGPEQATSLAAFSP